MILPGGCFRIMSHGIDRSSARRPVQSDLTVLIGLLMCQSHASQDRRGSFTKVND